MKIEEIIRKIYPKLVANELVSVQPMDGSIFCLKYQKPTIPEWVIGSDLIQFCDDNRYSIDTDDEKY